MVLLHGIGPGGKESYSNGAMRSTVSQSGYSLPQNLTDLVDLSGLESSDDPTEYGVI